MPNFRDKFSRLHQFNHDTGFITEANFAAIDFETANFRNTSVCSVGIIIVNDSRIVESIYSLIRPTPNFYIPRFTEIHGLTRADTDDQPRFPEVWARIAPRIAGLPLVAHNKAFDEGCLRAVHAEYDIPYPDYKFYCTLQASRKCLALPNHQLHTVAAHCGFNLHNHHHALADAEACAAITIHLINQHPTQQQCR